MAKWSAVWLGVLLGVALWAGACSGDAPSPSPTAPTRTTAVAPPAGGSPPESPTTPPTTPIPPVGTGTATVVAVGDIGWCGSQGLSNTAKLLQSTSGPIILAGDLAYPRGRMTDFMNCFNPEFGKFRGRWRPVPGNHEYEDAGGEGYFGYFGADAGPARRGYYAFRAAAWQVLMLNSSAPASTNSEQYLWAREELRNHPTRCTMAVWHHPYATSGPNGPNVFMRDMWNLLHEWGADVVVAAHDHLYERFGPMDGAYQPDRERGIRQFIAGTGGAPLYRAVSRFPNSEIIIEAFGALKLTLQPTYYEWEFVDAMRGIVADRGTAQCH